MYNVLDRMRKEAVMSIHDVLSQYLHRGFDDNYKDLSQDRLRPGKDSNME
jgi:uncharacterized protein (UPF0248 family)